ncbi:hypothetical protein C8R43DRAFT_1138597 [Mycena crocata]|nr:hypothetical protein C8R43DRAFT_1138597 [Mycena crocata]
MVIKDPGLTDALLIITEEALGLGPEESTDDANELAMSGASFYLRKRWLDAREEFKEGKNDLQLGRETKIYLRRLARMRYQLFTMKIAIERSYGPSSDHSLVEDMRQKGATGAVKELVKELVRGSRRGARVHWE